MSDMTHDAGSADGIILDQPPFLFSTAIHKDIGGMADDRLNGTDTQATVRKIIQAKLGMYMTLGSALVAAWADSVKRMTPEQAKQIPDQQETSKFLADTRNKGNGNWHFANLPAATPAYKEGISGTDPHDVVHMLQAAIQTLKGDTPDRFSQLNALRLLVHLTGDVHQPLHVGCSYIRSSADGDVELIIDPAKAKGLRNDIGGNALMISNSKNLHALWDDTLPNGAELADDLTDTDDPDPAMPAGSIVDWPRLWATETVQVAKQAYEGIMAVDLAGDVAPQHHQGGNISIKLPNGYQSHFAPIARRQAAVAARRLAATLKALFP